MIQLLVAAPCSGSGKTTLTCALLAALKRRGQDPCSFKSGPDYIDPMFHRAVLGVKSHNLDLFFSAPETVRALYAQAAAGQVEPADLLRQSAVLQGAEPAELCPRPLQCFQRFGVGEAKRRIPRNGNGNAGALFLSSLGRQLSRMGEPICVHQRRCALGQGKKLFPIHHQRIGHPADLLL